MDYAVGLKDAGNRNRGCSTLLVGQNELAILHRCRQLAALHGGQHCFAPAGLDLPLLPITTGETAANRGHRGHAATVSASRPLLGCIIGLNAGFLITAL